MIERTLDSFRAFFENDKIQYALLLPLLGPFHSLYEILMMANINATKLFRNDTTRFLLNMFFNQPLQQLSRVLISFSSAFVALFQSMEVKWFMQSWLLHPLFSLIAELSEALSGTSKAFDVMLSNLFVKYILISISEAPFIMLGYLTYQITMVRSTDFVRFLERLIWINLYAPLIDFLKSTIMVIIGYYDSSSVRWVRGKLWDVIIWLKGVTAT